MEKKEEKRRRMQTQIFSGPPEEDFGADALIHDTKCPNCQTENPPEATVCSKCGMRLLKKGTKVAPGMPKVKPPGQA